MKTLTTSTHHCAGGARQCIPVAISYWVEVKHWVWLTLNRKAYPSAWIQQVGEAALHDSSNVIISMHIFKVFRILYSCMIYRQRANIFTARKCEVEGTFLLISAHLLLHGETLEAISIHKTQRVCLPSLLLFTFTGQYNRVVKETGAI